MNDDDLLRSVVNAARAERAARDPAHERLTSGEATSDELRGLEARAAQDADAARALALHRPLDGAAHDRIASAILGARDASLPVRPSPPLVASVAAKKSRVAARPSKQNGNVRRLFYVLPPLAAAAALLLFLQSRGGPALPAYELTLRPASDVRLSPAPLPSGGEPVRLHPSSTLDLVLRPAELVSGPVAVRAVLVRDGQVTAWNPTTESAPGGAVRIRARVDTMFPEPTGSWDIVLAVARPAALPSPEQLARHVTSTGGAEPARDVRYLRTKVAIVTEP